MKYYCFYFCCLFFRSLLGKSWWYLYTVKDSQEKLSSPFSLSLCHTQTCMVLAVQCLSENNSSLTTSSLWLHRAIRGTPVVVRAVWVHFLWIFFFCPVLFLFFHFFSAASPPGSLELLLLLFASDDQCPCCDLAMQDLTSQQVLQSCWWHAQVSTAATVKLWAQ